LYHNNPANVAQADHKSYQNSCSSAQSFDGTPPLG
jgi:hypothetical protein